MEFDRIHRESFAIDSHVDTAMRCRDEGFDFLARNSTGHIDLPRMRDGGLDALVMAVYMGAPAAGEEEKLVDEALFRIQWIRSLTERNPDELVLALGAADMRRAFGERKAALMIGIEGGHIINGSLDLLRQYHNLGVRVLTLTHVFHHDWADSAGFDESLPDRHGGLSPFGRDVIGELNRLGILVDLSHSSDKNFHDVLEISRVPVAATHSGCRALCDHRRNLSDEMIEALARKGGVIQIPFYPTFIDQGAGRKVQAAEAEREPLIAEARKTLAEGSEELAREIARIEKLFPPEGTPLELLLDHIDHAIGLVGADHVGLGSDWDGIPRTVDGVEDCTGLPNVTRGLLDRGHDESVVRRVLGDNFLRLLDAVTGGE